MENQLQEIQMIEQNLQNLMIQKQSFELELSETQSALKELGNSGDEVFKIIGQLMLKSDRNKVKEELENKEKLIELRINSMEKQENSLNEKLQKLRDDVLPEK